MVEWSCYHDPLRLRLGFDDLSPRETTPRQTPICLPFPQLLFFRAFYLFYSGCTSGLLRSPPLAHSASGRGRRSPVFASLLISAAAADVVLDTAADTTNHQPCLAFFLYSWTCAHASPGLVHSRITVPPSHDPTLYTHSHTTPDRSGLEEIHPTSPLFWTWGSHSPSGVRA